MTKEHSIHWEDGGSAGVSCSTGEVFMLTVAGYEMGEDTPRACPECGQLLRLVWDVRVEVVE